MSPVAAPPPRFWLILGRDPRQRTGLSMTLAAAVVYLASLMAQWTAVFVGYSPVPGAIALTAVVIIGEVSIYILIRSGYTMRFADPALTLPQMLFAMGCLAAGLLESHYAMGQGFVLMLTVLVLGFGSFQLSPRQCRLFGWLAVATFGVAIVVGAMINLEAFDPAKETILFIGVAAAYPLAGFVAGRQSENRLQLRTQRRELRAALAQLRQMATHDELTGLPNRRHALEWIEAELNRARRKGHPLCLAVLDLDHFKRVNDVLGHSAGDTVLRIFAREATATLRAGTMLARWGGEEFLLGLPEADLPQAAAVIGRMREHLAPPQRWRDLPAAQVTFSAGLVQHLPGDSFDDSFRRADAALYTAKQQGRDRTVMA